MNAPVSTIRRAEPVETTAVFEAIGDTMATAVAYAEIALRFAECRDTRGLAYAARCLSAATLAAAELVEELPRPKSGGPAR